MNYATPYILTNPQDKNEEIVILGNFVSIEGYLPFEKSSEKSPFYLDISEISRWVESNIKKASMFHSDLPIRFFDSNNQKVNAILATALTDEHSLRLLSKNKSATVRKLVAGHNIPEILKVLKSDENAIVRFEVLKHNNTDILMSMLKEDVNINLPTLVKMSKHNNQEVIDEILNIVMTDHRMQNVNNDLIFENIIAHGNKQDIDKIFQYSEDGEDLGMYSIIALSKQNVPNIHNKILEEMLDSPCEYSNYIANIASHGNKELLEKIISLAEQMPELQDDYFYTEPLKVIAEQDIEAFQLRLAQMDSPLLKKELGNSKHKNVLSLISIPA